MRKFNVARWSQRGVLLTLLLTGGCESRDDVFSQVAVGFRDTTIRPIERVLEGKPAALTTSESEAAYASALPVLKGDAAAADTPKLVAELRAAAESGHAPSQNLLGMLYDRGRGLPQNQSEAVMWYWRAAEQGLAVAEFNLALMHRTAAGTPRNDADALYWFERAANRGHAEAQYQLALMLEDGIGTPPNMVAAVAWYLKSAQSGYAPAQHNLAVAYVTGNGVAKDEARAAMWYRAAADQGLAASQLRLGMALAQGSGVARDLPEAWVRLMQAAAAAGNNAELRSYAETQARSVEAQLRPAQLEKARQDLAGRQQGRG